MPSPFDEAEQAVKAGSANPFDQAEAKINESKKLGFGGNVGELAKHFVSGVNPLNILGPPVDLAMSALPGIAGEGARKRLYEGFVEPTVTGIQATKDAYNKGNYGQAIIEAGKSVPIFGQPIVGGMERIYSEGNWGAPVGDAAAAILMHKAVPGAKKALTATGEGAYEGALNLSSRVPLKNREALVERGLRSGPSPIDPTGQTTLAETTIRPTPISRKTIELDKLNIDSKPFRDQIDYLTKDPSSPISQNLIPVDNVLSSARKFADRVYRTDPGTGTAIHERIDHWAESMGAKPATTTTSPLIGANGQPITTTTPAITDVKIADVQRLKEDLNSLMPSGNFRAMDKSVDVGKMALAQKLAARGAQQAIEGQAPNAMGGFNPIHEINGEISTALKLQSAIDSAIRRKSGWWKDWGAYTLGTVAAGLLEAGHTTSAEVAVGAAMVRMALRDPAVMSRLGIALNTAGVKLPMGLQKLGLPNAAIGASKAGYESQKRSQERSAGVPDVPTAENPLM